jgi:hypothetical protein
MTKIFYPLIISSFAVCLSAQGQIARWKFNNNANDASANAINGTALNSPTYTADSKEGAYSLTLNGTNQYIDFGNPTQVPAGTSARSLSAWAKTATTTGTRQIAAYGTATIRKSMGFGMNGTTLTAGAFNDEFNVTSFWTTGVWHHIVLTYDGTTARLYVDGTEVTNSAKSWNLTRSTVVVGRNVNGNSYWNGQVDDVRIYDIALSAAQVTALAAVPPAPTSPSATAASSSILNLAWTDGSSTEAGFQIERSTTSGSGYTLINTTAANSTSFQDVGLTPLTPYYYRMRAVADNANSAYTSQFTATTLLPPPTAPTGLSASVVSSTAVNLSWTDASTTESGFEVERSTTLGTGFTMITTTAANATTFSDTGLSPVTTYYYRIRSKNAGGSSAYTSEAAATTPVAPPAAPTGLTTAVASSTVISLSWTDASSTETGFEVERSTTSGSGFALISTTAANATSFSDTGLSPTTTYYYRVRSMNAGGASAYTSEATATTEATPPTTPTGLLVNALSTTSIKADWTDASSDETAFEVERSLTSASGFTLLTTTAANVATFTDTGLNPGTQYYYRIRAIKGAVASSYTSVSNATTVPLPPAGPTALTALASSPTSIVLSWTDGSNNETGFQIERSLSASGEFTLITTTAANATSQTDELLTSNTTYYYRVRAVNTGGSSSYAVSASVTTPVEPPAAPSGLSATAGVSSINLNWTDNSPNESQFVIERSTTSGTSFTVVSNETANTISYIDSDITGGQPYFYRIKATNAGGNSVYSDEVTATLNIPGVTQLCKGLFCDSYGSVGVGTQIIPSGYRLSIKGKMMAEGVRVDLQSAWPDYVFDSRYELQDLPSLRSYINKNKHLPGMPAASEVDKEGFDVGQVNVKLLEKIEELSLYLIQMEERIQKLEVENKTLKEESKRK